MSETPSQRMKREEDELKKKKADQGRIEREKEREKRKDGGTDIGWEERSGKEGCPKKSDEDSMRKATGDPTQLEGEGN